MKFFDKILFHSHYTKLNLFKTFLFNIKTMPFNIAIKFPVLLYGKIDFYDLSGKIEFYNCSIQTGMIKMGLNKEFLGTVKGSSLIILQEESRVIFEGNCEVSSNFLFRVSANGVLTIGKNTFIGNSSKIVCVNQIKIGESLRLGFESQIIDSDFHYIYDLEKNIVLEREKEINIGKFNWIGNRTIISKGTKTNPFTIVGNYSILNKDYTINNDKYVVLAGQPAKIISINKRRIYDLKIEEELVKLQKYRKQTMSQELKNKIIESFNSNC